MKKNWTKPSIIKIENRSIKSGTYVTSAPEAYVNLGSSSTFPCAVTTTAGGCVSFTTGSFYYFATGSPGVAACNQTSGMTAQTVCS